jgi:hypothetical protein
MTTPLHRLALLIAGLAAAAVLLALGAPAPASAQVVGIGDQNAETFSDPRFLALGVKRSRFFPPWDGIFKEPERLDGWLNAAREAGVEPYVAFNHSRGNVCPKRPCTLPSVRAYTRAFKAFRKRYPWVRIISPWNEINSPTQPTGRNPRRAAEYYNVVRANCRGCKIVAADIQDLSPRTMTRYVRTFRRYTRGTPRLWGLHNYTDTNRFRTSGTQTMLKLVPGKVWLTETGGIYRRRGSGSQLAASERRQARATEHMFRIGRKYRSRIERIYIYQWKATNASDRFDAGLVDPNGEPRRAYDVVRKNRRLIR